LTFLTNGNESQPSASFSVALPGNKSAIKLTNIPLGPVGTTARYLYRTEPGGADYKLIYAISNNVDTEYTDKASDHNPLRLKLAVQAIGNDTRVFAALITNRPSELYRIWATDNLGTNWRFVVDTPGAHEVAASDTPGVQRSQFFGLNPGGQGDTHFSMAADPTTLDVIYLGGDTQKALGDKSSVGNVKWGGRLFKLNTSTGAAAGYLVNIRD